MKNATTTRHVPIGQVLAGQAMYVSANESSRNMIES